MSWFSYKKKPKRDKYTTVILDRIQFYFYEDKSRFLAAISDPDHLRKNWVGATFKKRNEIHIYMGTQSDEDRDKNKRWLGHEVWHLLEYQNPEKFTDPDIDGGRLK